MNEIEENFQVIYYSKNNSLGCAMNLIRFGYAQFLNNTKVKEINLYRNLCFDTEKNIENDKLKISSFVLNNLIDSIRIVICFENYLKAIHLANGYLIHKLNKDIFPELAKQQFSRPILLSEIINQSKWEINEKLKTKNENTKNQIKGIMDSTISMKVLLSKEYLSIIKFPEDIANICKTYNEYRNNLHFYISERISFSKESYQELIKLVDYVNVHVVRIHNLMINKIGKDEQYKIKKIEYSA